MTAPGPLSVGGQTVPDLFEAQAARSPSAVAVEHAGVTWTYRRLNQAADAIAHSLRRHGIGRGCFVVVRVRRGPALVAALLGVWKSGAAAVPVDSDQGLARLSGRLVAGPAVAAVSDRAASELPGVAPVVDAHETPDGPAADPPPLMRPDDAAYVVLTSGSSGEPKGIVGLHRGVLNYFDDLRRREYIGEHDVVIQLSAVTFDASLRDLVFPLTVGARTVVVPDGGRDVVAAWDVIATAGVTAILAVVPSLLRELVREAQRRGVVAAAVRVVLVSGERLYQADLAGARGVFPNARIANLYGPSECTMTSTSYEPRDPSADGPDVPIGRSIDGVTAFVLDRGLQLAPPGHVGELYIAGAGLSRGYWNQPALTAERFVPHPYGRGGQRMYRTGDRARLRPDGALEFLGRVDDQVKLRGIRVELGEVEAALRAVPEIADAACRLWADPASLVAHLVWADPARVLTVGELRDRLLARLPEYLLPAVFVPVDHLPRTVSGKVDRRALPDPTGQRSPLLADTVAPRNRSEELMAAVWRDVLGVPAVGVHDSFFDLGGHSLLAMRLVARMADTLQLDVPLRAVFETPTIAALAGYTDGIDPRRARGARIAALAPGQPRRLAPAQRHVWSMDRLAGGGPGYNVVGIARLRGELNEAALEQATAEVVRRHEILRASFPEVDGAPVLRIAPAAPLRLSVVDPGAAGRGPSGVATLRTAVGDLAQAGFDLRRGPLLRSGLLRISAVEHMYHLVVHHIVFDGSSMAIFFRELAVLYAAFAAGRSSSLPDLPLQYTDLATWQAERAADGSWTEDVAYWREQLTGASPLVRVPDGYPFTAANQRDRAQRTHTLDSELVARLTTHAAKARATPPMLLFAAFAVALHVSCGVVNFHVAMPVTNRGRPERADMIGLVANTVLVHTDMSGDPDLGTVVGRTRTTLLEAYAHAEPPWETVADNLLPGARTPDVLLAQAMFNLQERESRPVEAAGLTIEPADTDDIWARYPIAMFVTWETGHTVVQLVFDRQLFDGEWADRTMAAMLAAVTSIVDDNDRPVSSLRGQP